MHLPSLIRRRSKPTSCQMTWVSSKIQFLGLKEKIWRRSVASVGTSMRMQSTINRSWRRLRKSWERRESGEHSQHSPRTSPREMRALPYQRTQKRKFGAVPVGDLCPTPSNVSSATGSLVCAVIIHQVDALWVESAWGTWSLAPPTYK